MTVEPLDLAAGAIAVLQAADPAEKARIVQYLLAAGATWPHDQQVVPPDRPARPERPLLLMPRDMPRRKAGGSAEKRIALLHALAHIELNAINLAFDMIARWGHAMPVAFHAGWLKVGGEEALHFTLLSERLAAFGAGYGDLPAHDGLWLAAIETSHDLLARLAIVPLVLEARGLDVTPSLIESVGRSGDVETVAVLERIYRDEIGHVAIGMRWFETVARDAGHEPAPIWRQLVAKYFRGVLKPPFNVAAREAAGMPAEFYIPTA